MILQSLKMAWSAITSNKMRSFLTMLGIIIGVVAVVVLISLVSGATNTVTDQIKSIGTNLLSVNVRDDKGTPLKLEDMQEFSELESVGAVSPVLTGSGTVKRNSSNENAMVYGTTTFYETIRGLKLAGGRFIRTADVNNISQIAIISDGIRDKMFPTEDPIGQTIYLNGMEFMVVGVLEEDTSMMASLMAANLEVYIPFTTYSRIYKQNEVSTFYASSTTEEEIDNAEDQLTALLMSKFKHDEDAFNVLNQSSILDTMNEVTGTMTSLLGGIAAISLLVGGIGIMNIMLVSVTERTREIGIRKAIGAKRGNILMQFLIEALVISLLGGLVGLGFAWVILTVVSMFTEISFTISLGVLGLAMGFSTVIGIVFGLYPANKAAQLHPIEALRHE